MSARKHPSFAVIAAGRRCADRGAVRAQALRHLHSARSGSVMTIAAIGLNLTLGYAGPDLARAGAPSSASAPTPRRC